MMLGTLGTTHHSIAADIALVPLMKGKVIYLVRMFTAWMRQCINIIFRQLEYFTPTNFVVRSRKLGKRPLFVLADLIAYFTSTVGCIAWYQSSLMLKYSSNTILSFCGTLLNSIDKRFFCVALCWNIDIGQCKISHNCCCYTPTL